MTTLHELRDMLAKAEGPSRELDDIIALTLDGYVVRKIGGLPHFTTPEEMIFAPPGKPAGVPSYTSSIDAALALVERLLPGWKWEVGNPFWKEGIVVCRLARPGATDWSSSLVESEDSPTAPLAILKALSEALSEALIAKEKTDG